MEKAVTPETIAERPPADQIALSNDSDDLRRPVAPMWHLAVVLILQLIVSYRGQVRFQQLQVPGEIHRIALYERIILTEFVMLFLVLAGVWWQGSSIFTVLGTRWRSLADSGRDFAIGAGFLVVTIMIGSILNHGGDRSATRLLLPQGRNEMWAWTAVALTAGICEEALFRGYLQRQFIAVTKSVPAGIILSAILFGAGHGYQGIARAFQISVLGLLAGILAYRCKSVRPGMIAHAAQDILGGLIRHS